MMEQDETLKIWQSARSLVRLVYSLTRASDAGVTDSARWELRRSAASLLSSVAHGLELRGGGLEGRGSLLAARATCAELCSQLGAAHAVGVVGDGTLERALTLAGEFTHAIGGERTLRAARILELA